MNSHSSQVSRYHPASVALHWLVALMSIAALIFGAVKLAHIPSSDPYKIRGLRVHMIVGMLILALMWVRLFVRAITARPPKVTSGHAPLNAVARLSQPLLYLTIMGQACLGVAAAYQAGLFGAVFAHRGTIPSDLWIYWPSRAHYVLSRVLMILIAVHIGGTLYHALAVRDGLLRRMWFARR